MTLVSTAMVEGGRDAGMIQLIVAGSKSWRLFVKTGISQGIVPRATSFKLSSIGDFTVCEAQPGHILTSETVSVVYQPTPTGVNFALLLDIGMALQR